MAKDNAEKRRRLTLTGVAAAIALTVGAATLHYSNQVRAEQEPAVVANPTPQAVEVTVVAASKIRVWHKFSGRLQAVDRVEIKPRVSGMISEVTLQEGAKVNKGDLLFVIDQRPYQASLDRAEAALQEAEAEVELTRNELTRARQLVRKKSVSKSRFDSAKSAHKAALAKVAAANAALTQAELNHEFTHVRAPISGRIDRAELTVGNLVEAGPGAPTLTSIVSTDQIYATFDVDEQTYLDSVRRQRGGVLPVELRLAGDAGKAYHGKIDSFGNQMDPNTGTIRARAILDNRDGALLPGMFADVRLGAANKTQQLLISERSVGTNQDQKYVYVVTEENEVAYREVKLGRSLSGQRIVLSGLDVGDKVMVNSLQRVQPGAKVRPVPSVDRTSALAANARG